MDRRDFLKLLLSVGASVVLPNFNISEASATEFNLELERYAGQHFNFLVSEFGTLTTENVEFPETRSACLGIDISDFPTTDSLLEVLYDNTLYYSLAKHYLDDSGLTGDPFEVDMDDLRDWLDKESSSRTLAEDEVQKWLDSTDLDENDCESADLRGYSPQGNALWFFRDVDFDLDEIGVVIVEGDRPGSSYFAAELRIPIEEANEIAERLGLEFRFKGEGVA